MKLEPVHPIALTNGTIVTPFRVAREKSVVIDGGKISQMAERSELHIPRGAEVIDLEGRTIAPGFIDLHVHGGNGFSFNDADHQGLDAIVDHAVRHGTTQMLATLYLDEEGKFLDAIRNIVSYASERQEHSVVCGLHLEGPFVNPKMAGAMNAEHVWDPTIGNWARLKKAGEGFIKMMTIAPELPGSLEIMRVAALDGVTLAIAHSTAKYENIEVAIDNGLSQVTHMFNAMHPMHHREPGIVTAAMLKRELKLHLIADGVHVHPAVMSLLFQLKGDRGIILITDAIGAAGKDDGIYDLAGQTVTVRGGSAYLGPDTLAGSTLTMERAVRTIIDKVDMPLTAAYRMATLNPARVLGLDDTKGIIAVGRDADLVVIDERGDVSMTIIGGCIGHRAD